MRRKVLFVSIFIGVVIGLGGDHVIAAPAADDCWQQLRGAMSRMHEATAQLKPTANSDDDFVRLMVPHHQAAIDMAKEELLCGRDPQIRRLAQEIITDQQQEIVLMQHWRERQNLK